MGNGSSGKPIQLHGKAKLAASKFDLDEMHVLHKTWQDMSDRNHGKGESSSYLFGVVYGGMFIQGKGNSS